MRSSVFRALSAFAAAAALPLAMGCGESTPRPVTPAGPSGATAAAPEAPLPASWSDSLPKEQQVAFMKKNVMPAIAPVFAAHDAAKYATVDCKLCHGPDRKNPHEVLPHLTMKDGKLTAFAEKPEVARFMADVVTGKMAAAMGLPPFDMTTHKGFGCGGCHTVDMK